MIWCEFTVNSNEPMLVGCIYRSPNTKPQINSELQKTLKSVADLNSNHLLIMGDFNLPNIDWIKGSCDAGRGSIDFQMWQTFNDCFWHQHVLFPTRIVRNQSKSTLDLLFTSDDNLINIVKQLPPIGKSDHIVLIFNLMVSRQKIDDFIKILDWQKADFGAINEVLAAIDWSDVLDDLNAEDANKYIEKILLHLVAEHVPERRIIKGHRLKWETKKGRKLRNSKAAAFHRYKMSKSYRDYQTYAVVRNKVTAQLRKDRKEFESNLAKDCGKNTKKLFAYYRSKSKTKQGINCIKRVDGELTRNSEETAQAISDHFKTVYTRESSGPLPQFCNRVPENKCCETIQIREFGVQAKLMALDPGKSAGPDNIYPRLLKECATTLSKPLTILLNKSISEGSVPSSWKKANVTPIYKKGSRTDSDNYRPISLTSVLSKLLEKFVKETMLNHMIDNNLFSNAQYGFRSRRSCVLQLLAAMEDWTQTIDEGIPVDVIYLDFKKAFDSVPHRRLLEKISAYGFRGNLLKWIADFLSDRHQRVKVGDSFSNWASILSGVPQGSVLGPMLFLIFINDLPDSLHSCIKLFADDTKLYSSVSTQNSHQLLQSDLQLLLDWSTTWELPFNINKCVVLHLGPNNICNPYSFNIGESDHLLHQSTAERDLGITIDNRLDFSHHIGNIIKKANSQVGLIKRSFVIRDPTAMLQLYKATVRPILEYGSPVWSPWKLKHIREIERVQRRFSKLIDGVRGLGYTDRLRRLNLPTLQYRRKRENLIQVYKLINNLYDIDYKAFFEKSNSRTTRGNSYKLQVNRSRLASRTNFFSQLIVHDWNSLPEEVVAAHSLNQFKNRLEQQLVKERFAPQ